MDEKSSPWRTGLLSMPHALRRPVWGGLGGGMHRTSIADRGEDQEERSCTTFARGWISARPCMVAAITAEHAEQHAEEGTVRKRTKSEM